MAETALWAILPPSVTGIPAYAGTDSPKDTETAKDSEAAIILFVFKVSLH